MVGGINSTHIFLEQDGNWEETITLDQRYDYYALSGGQLLAATSTEVHASDAVVKSKNIAQHKPLPLNGSIFFHLSYIMLLAYNCDQIQ